MNSYGSNLPLTAEGRSGLFLGNTSFFLLFVCFCFFFFTNMGTTVFNFPVILFNCSLTTSYSYFNIFRSFIAGAKIPQRKKMVDCDIQVESVISPHMVARGCARVLLYLLRTHGLGLDGLGSFGHPV